MQRLASRGEGTHCVLVRTSGVAVWDLARGIRVVSLAVAASIIAGMPVHAQATTPQKFIGRLIGVYDEQSGNPIDSAEVRDMISGSSALTTSTGTVSLFFVDTAGSLIRIRKVGYTPVTMFVSNSPSETAPLTITLQPLAQVLPTVVTIDSMRHYVGANLRAFEERRRRNVGGYFISEAEIQKEEDRPFAQTIRAHIPSVDVVDRRTRQQRGSFVISRRSVNCAVDVYLDGVLLTTASNGNDISQFETSTIAGVEFYNTASAPPEYNRTVSGCGVLLIWTREK